MSTTHINNIQRCDLDKHIHKKKLILYKVIPNKDVVNYIIFFLIKEDKYWVDLGYEIANLKYLWIEYYFNIILNNFGTSDNVSHLFNKIDNDYINIKDCLDNYICEKYNNLKYLPEYPEIKITKIFYNLLDLYKPYTIKIRGNYQKKLHKKEKIKILELIELHKKYIHKIEKYYI